MPRVKDNEPTTSHEKKPPSFGQHGACRYPVTLPALFVGGICTLTSFGYRTAPQLFAPHILHKTMYESGDWPAVRADLGKSGWKWLDLLYDKRLRVLT